MISFSKSFLHITLSSAAYRILYGILMWSRIIVPFSNYHYFFEMTSFLRVIVSFIKKLIYWRITVFFTEYRRLDGLQSLRIIVIFSEDGNLFGLSSFYGLTASLRITVFSTDYQFSKKNFHINQAFNPKTNQTFITSSEYEFHK